MELIFETVQRQKVELKIHFLMNTASLLYDLESMWKF
jgi:hypothetical protein